MGEDCTSVHVVAAGDNCTGIDAAAGIDLQTLMANNRQLDGNCANIYPGEVIGCLIKSLLGLIGFFCRFCALRMRYLIISKRWKSIGVL